MLFLSALGYAVGIVSGLIGFYLFLESRTHPRARQRAMVFGVAAMVILVVTYLVANQQSSLRASEPGITPAPTSPGPGVTPVQTTPYRLVDHCSAGGFDLHLDYHCRSGCPASRSP